MLQTTTLQSKVKELERQLGVKSNTIAKTSANSSIPPSKNPIGVPHTQSQRKPSGKKSGGQKGHPGSTRLQTDNVTATERWYPAAVCPVCGKPLDMDSATVGARRQEVDIPLPIEAKVIDHLLMQVKCSCGHCCKGQFPEAVNAPVNFGPNITALVSYLSTYQNVPFKRLTHLLETIFGLHVSEGSVSNMLNSMRKFSKESYEMIRQKVASGKVAGADETGVNDSEKALRPAKTKLKVSGCFRTQAGAQNYATVASVIQTAVKNGQNPFEVLRVIATLALT